MFDNVLISIGIAGSITKNRWVPLQSETSEAAVVKLLECYRISDYRDRQAGLLPQGVRKLLDICMAMVGSPRILLLDEPTSGVSAEEKMVMMDTILEIIRPHEVGILFVEHDMEVVEQYANRVVAFSEGKIIADGPPTEVMSDAGVREMVVGSGLQSKQP